MKNDERLALMTLHGLLRIFVLLSADELADDATASVHKRKRVFAYCEDPCWTRKYVFFANFFKKKSALLPIKILHVCYI